MHEETIFSLLDYAARLLDEAKREDKDFDASDAIAAGIAKAQCGIDKEIERKKLADTEDDKLDLRKLSIRGYKLDKDLADTDLGRGYYIRDDDEDDLLTIATAKAIEPDIGIQCDRFVVAGKYVDGTFEGSYLVVTDARRKWSQQRYDDLSRKIEKAFKLS